MSKVKINCCFCSWTGEADNNFHFTCPTCGIDFGAIDDDGHQKANDVLSEFIEKYQAGRTDFPAVEDISFACCKLQAMSGNSENSSARKLFSQLFRKNGIQYSKILPLIIEFQVHMNTLTSKSKRLTTLEHEKAPLMEEELPF